MNFQSIVVDWAENTDPVASVAFTVFSPAFDGKDKREAE